ncbi:MAG: hypothetical protein J7499_03380 [Sphingopyxis sp.]|nr:hypothetical protein [Sphingopyxis sp.]
MSESDGSRWTRREIIELGLVAPALAGIGLPAAAQAGATPWRQGSLIHLIPTASHDRILIKASFAQPFAKPPRLMVGRDAHAGIRSDPDGRFWRFDVAGLKPATTHDLRIVDGDGAAICDPWPLRTFPAPDATAQRMRILAYTCAGGYDGVRMEDRSVMLDMAARRRLLARGLGFAPDAVIANGDHIYWDLETALARPRMKRYQELVWPRFGGALDTSVPMLHPRNAAIFTAVCDYQIAGLYGVSLRSTPAFFLPDDHDAFENDEFTDKAVTLPPDTYGTLGAEETQQLYYPEFLPDATRPEWLPGGGRTALPPGTNGNFGTLRFGTLVEALFYDCRRFVDYKGAQAHVVPRWTEDWLVARTIAEDTRHLLHIPSLPFGYSSGKLGDWYPDKLDDATGRLTLENAKAGWQEGWYRQGQRIVEAAAAQRTRAGIFVQGDLHVSGAGLMTGSRDREFPRPVHIIQTGTLGSGDTAFPSQVRGVETAASQMVTMQELMKPVEKNGFTIIDVTPETVKFSLFTWRPPQPVEEIDTMTPVFVHEVARPA